MGPTKRWEMRITENPADLIQTQRSWPVFGLSLGKEACGPIFYRSICIWECGPKKILHLTSPFHFFIYFIKRNCTVNVKCETICFRRYEAVLAVPEQVCVRETLCDTKQDRRLDLYSERNFNSLVKFFLK